MNQNLIRRILTAVVSLGILIPLLTWASWGVWLFCLVVSVLGLWEYYQLTGFVAPKYRLPSIGLGVFLWFIVLLREHTNRETPEFSQPVFYGGSFSSFLLWP